MSQSAKGYTLNKGRLKESLSNYTTSEEGLERLIDLLSDDASCFIRTPKGMRMNFQEGLQFAHSLEVPDQ